MGNIEDVIYCKGQIETLVHDLVKEVGNSIPNTFWTVHGRPKKRIIDTMNELVQVKPLIMTTIRDPMERLRSHIKYISTKVDTYEELMKEIKENKGNYTNIYSKYLEEAKEEKEDQNQSIIDERQKIRYFKHDNNYILEKIKSIYISTAGIPNIIQPKYMNRSSSRNHDIKYHNWADNALKYCKTNGYMDEDIQWNMDELIQTTMNELIVPDIIQKEKNYLHPNTIIIESEKKARIVKTNEYFDTITKAYN